MVLYLIVYVQFLFIYLFFFDHITFSCWGLHIEPGFLVKAKKKKALDNNANGVSFGLMIWII